MSDTPFFEIPELKQALSRELHNAWVFEETPPIPDIPFYQRVVDDAQKADPTFRQRVKAWVDGYGGFKTTGTTGRWTAVPKNPELEKELYQPLTDIIDSIIVGLGNAQEPNPPTHGPVKTRRVVLTAKLAMEQAGPEDPEDTGVARPLKSCPDISVFGSGPCSASERKGPAKPSYPDTCASFEIKLDDKLTPRVQAQLSVYAYETLIQQPNRNFVRIPLITAETFRLVHFDRGGVHAAAPFNYHTNPVLFAQLIFLLTSLNEEQVGYDTSIRWEDGSRCIIVNASSQWSELDGAWHMQPRVLRLRVVGDPTRPVFSRPTIRSRGTKCWVVRDGDQEFYVKDYWMSRQQSPESKFLADIRGIFGVAEMHAWQDNIATVYGQRLHESDKLEATFSDDPSKKDVVDDRVLMRLVLKRYAGTLNEAATAVHLLSAVRDIVVGHQRVFEEKQIIHGDISASNILLTSDLVDSVANVQTPVTGFQGSAALANITPVDDAQASLPRAPPETLARAALIDFDMARRISDGGSTNVNRMGTMLFRSIKVLSDTRLLAIHDVLDDLESVAYVICFVSSCYDASGSLHRSLPSPFKQWIRADSSVLATLKSNFLAKAHLVTTRFSTSFECEVVEQLILDLGRFFHPHVDRVSDVLGEVERVAKMVDGKRMLPEAAEAAVDDARARLALLSEEANLPVRSYIPFLRLLDEALVKLHRAPPQAPLPPPTPKRPRHHAIPSIDILDSLRGQKTCALVFP
ncbi:hypothetical protein HMN09_00950300 [Mycena chlorophos]|uniref:Fungal-type protein kinase domain-containing protein n=1 Tax=Mycena chlorophos TaxID=658473 RepID=A0A8H6W3S2_MYCCL|nr:hypothetical protein HMN09_00950300 [Mycena chlorophos]